MLVQILIIAQSLGVSLAASYNQVGCYKESDVSSFLTGGTSFQFQTSSHCEEQCQSGVIGLLNGQYCYCGDTLPAADLEVSMSNCNTPCFGFGTQNCGGDGYMLLFEDGSQQVETAGASSSSASSTSSSSSTSTSSSTTSKTKTTSSTSSSSSSTDSSSSDSSSDSGSSSQGQVTLVSTVTSTPTGHESASVKSITTTEPASQSTSSSSPSGTNNNNNSHSNLSSNKSKSSLSGGAIAGIVIGALAGVLLILGLIFFLIMYRKRRNEEDDDDFTLSGGRAVMGDGAGMQTSQTYEIGNNPFLAQSHGGSRRTNAATLAGSGMGAGMMHARRESSNQHNNSNSFSSHDHDEEYFLFDKPKTDITGEANKVSSEFGRRRLSNGSLPDMAARNPGSLKVVNN